MSRLTHIVSKVLVAVIASAMCQVVAAELQSSSDLIYGVNSITRDTISQLEWLDWNLTTGRSVSEVSSQLSLGVEFAGFRYATVEEIIELIDHAGFEYLYGWPGQTADYEAAQNLIGLLGQTEPAHSGAGYRASRAFLGPESQVIPGFNMEIVVIAEEGIQRGLAGANGGFEGPVGIGDGPTSFQGHALVRPIPEPATWILSAAILGVAIGLRCRPRNLWGR